MDEGLGVSEVPHPALCQDKGAWLGWADSSPGLGTVYCKAQGVRLIFPGQRTWLKVFLFLFLFLNPILWASLQVEGSLFKIKFVYGVAGNPERDRGEEEHWGCGGEPFATVMETRPHVETSYWTKSRALTPLCPTRSPVTFGTYATA